MCALFALPQAAARTIAQFTHALGAAHMLLVVIYVGEATCKFKNCLELVAGYQELP